MHTCMMYTYMLSLCLSVSLSLSLSLSLLRSEGTSDPSGKKESGAFLASDDNWHVNITYLRPFCTKVPGISVVELCVCSGRILQVPWLPFKCLGRRWKGGTLSYKITSFYNSSHSLTSRLQEETCNGATWTVCVTCTK